MQYKPEKKNSDPDALSCLKMANKNLSSADFSYSKLESLFVAIAILVNIDPDLLWKILKDYKSDSW